MVLWLFQEVGGSISVRCPKGKQCEFKYEDTIYSNLAEQGSNQCKHLKLPAIMKGGRRRSKLGLEVRITGGCLKLKFEFADCNCSLKFKLDIDDWIWRENFKLKFEVDVWSWSRKLKFEVEDIWSWWNLKLKKFEVVENWSWRNLKLKKIEVEENWS